RFYIITKEFSQLIGFLFGPGQPCQHNSPLLLTSMMFTMDCLHRILYPVLYHKTIVMMNSELSAKIKKSGKPDFLLTAGPYLCKTGESFLYTSIVAPETIMHLSRLKGTIAKRIKLFKSFTIDRG